MEPAICPWRQVLVPTQAYPTIPPAPVSAFLTAVECAVFVFFRMEFCWPALSCNPGWRWGQTPFGLISLFAARLRGRFLLLTDKGMC